jgi:hypothetical protein
MSHRARLCSIAVFIVALTTVLAQAEPPAAINIPEGLRSGSLLPVHANQVRARMEWWLNSIRVSDKNEDILDHRRRLLADYAFYEEPAYRQQAADIFVEVAGPFVTGDAYDGNDPLAMVKRINVAMAAARMDSSSTAPLLQNMVASDNAAIRFFGWNGYRNIRLPLLAGQVNRDLLAAVKSALAEEPSTVVLAEVFRVLDLKPAGLVGFDADARKRIAETLVPAVKPAWAVRLKQLKESDGTDMLRAMDTAVQTLGTYPSGDFTPAIRKMVLDVALAAGEIYSNALEAGNDSRADAAETLLLTAEKALLEQTPMTNQRIVKAMQQDAPGAAVQLALLDWQTELQEAALLPEAGDDPQN